MSSVEGRQDTCRHRNSAGKIYSAEQVDSIQQNEEIVARINTRQMRKSYNTDLIKISFDSSPHEKPPFDMCIHAKTNS
jgi:hypothetical protein